MSGVVMPGDLVKLEAGETAGSGMLVVSGCARSTLVGRVVRQGGVVAVEGKKPAVGVRVGDEVMGRVARITEKLAVVDILCGGGRALEGGFQGVVRKEHVRKTEVDKVIMEESFRPGDVVRARIIAVGEGRSASLSTAENDLGVVLGKGQLVPVSWEEMQNVETGIIERRKVAKPRTIQ